MNVEVEKRDTEYLRIKYQAVKDEIASKLTEDEWARLENTLWCYARGAFRLAEAELEVAQSSPGSPLPIED